MCKKSDKIYPIFIIIVALLFSILRVIIALFYTEEPFGVYSLSSTIPQIFDYLVITVIIFSALFPCILKKSFIYRNIPKNNSLSKFTGITLGFIFLIFSLIMIFSTITQTKLSTAETLLAVSGIFSSVYYLSKYLSKSENTGAKALLSMTPIIFAVIALVEIYFDMDILITSPNRAYHQTALLAFSLFLLAETRLELGFKNTLSYAPAAAASTILLAVSSIPNLVCYKILSTGHTDRPLIYAIELVGAFYCAARIINFCVAKEK